MVDEVHAQNLKASGVIQLLGGVGPNGNVQATILTQTLAQHLNCQAWLLPSQSIEGSMAEKNRLIASQDVADVVSRFDEVDIAIVGIGILEPSQLLEKRPVTTTTKICCRCWPSAARWGISACTTTTNRAGPC
ncbi:Transcriptional regulator, contains sigma factor-related N-terminal domain [Raoultella terrigena]|uniref:Transcriptional regulator, contains sigma factor-related N-terminal domain n=1 Tax=Raoultella terrigena TaxID=577 RepID=A0A3P8JPY5_RAOTE|nr:Transcriptional regulator, contains sigma factor-related N-terminal domain [Raoultella terrigena]